MLREEFRWAPGSEQHQGRGRDELLRIHVYVLLYAVEMAADDNVPSGVDIAMLLRRAQLRKQLACEAALAQVGLTLPQWGMLYAVAAEPDSSTHALAVFIGQSDQSAGAVVARLEQRGLLERRPGSARRFCTESRRMARNSCDAATPWSRT